MPATYNHKLPWTEDDAKARSLYQKGVRGPRELEAHAKFWWVKRMTSYRKARISDAMAEQLRKALAYVPCDQEFLRLEINATLAEHDEARKEQR